MAWLARNQLLLKAVQAVRSQMERLPAEALTATGKEVNYRWALSFGTCFDIANPHWGAVCIPELMLQFVDPCLGMGIARESMHWPIPQQSMKSDTWQCLEIGSGTGMSS